MNIVDKLNDWWSNGVDTAHIYDSFIATFTAQEVLRGVDHFIDEHAPQPKEAYEHGGAVTTAILWMLCGHKTCGFPPNGLVDRIAKHYGFDYRTVTPRCALRQALAARLILRQADRQLSRYWPVEGGLLDAIVCKLDGAHDVYQLSTEVLNTVLDN